MIKFFLFVSLLVFSMSVFAQRPDRQRPNRPDMQQEPDNKIALQREKAIGNLIVKLDLTRSQAVSLLDLAKQAVELRKKYLPNPDNKRNDDERPSSERNNGEKLGQPMPKKFVKAMKELEVQLNKLLTPEQHKIIEEFRPKNVKDQERMGQSGNNDRFIQIVDRIRKAPANREHLLNDFLQKHLQKAEENGGPCTTAERESLLAQWRKAILEARAMSDADYELAKDDILLKLKLPDKKTTSPEAIEKDGPDNKNQANRTIRLLLEPTIIPVLEQRLKMEAEVKKTIKLSDESEQDKEDDPDSE